MLNQMTATSITHTFNRNDIMPLTPHSFWCLRQGAVKTVTWSEEGTIVTLGYWGPGDVIGQPLSRIKPYQMKCISSVEAESIPLHQSNRLSDAIRLYIQQTEELLYITRSERTQERLFRILVWLAQKFGREVTQGKLIDLRLTHQELAEVTGATRVTITRLLRQLEQEGIISRPQRHAIVLRAVSQSF